MVQFFEVAMSSSAAVNDATPGLPRMSMLADVVAVRLARSLKRLTSSARPSRQFWTLNETLMFGMPAMRERERVLANVLAVFVSAVRLLGNAGMACKAKQS